MAYHLSLEVDENIVTWWRPDGQQVSMTVDEFHAMYDMSKTARFRVKYPALVHTIRHLAKEDATALLVEVLDMGRAEIDEILLELI